MLEDELFNHVPPRIGVQGPPHGTMCIGIHGDENVTIIFVLKKLNKLKRNMVNGRGLVFSLHEVKIQYFITVGVVNPVTLIHF